MTLAELVLPEVSSWRPSGTGRHSWSQTFASAGWTVRCLADQVDSLSCLAWQLELARMTDPPPGLTLASWAASIAGRVTGLLEPLKVHEIDSAAGVALLRSVAPARKGEDLAYYELRLDGLTTATVRRYGAYKARPGRRQVPFAVTHEALAKLVGDIAG